MESSSPYFDPDFDSLIERLHSPRVCIDNDTCEDCTLVKVDSANRHGILLEMVQLLTDLDLVISKSYISSDGGWLMDVFHVTDQLGKKLTDPAMIHYVEQSLVVGRKEEPVEVHTCLGRVVGPGNPAAEQTALELTGVDRPGQLSEISAVLAQLGCYVAHLQAWTHNGRVACIIYLSDADLSLADIEAEVSMVVGAHHLPGERWSVNVSAGGFPRVHIERRLHQLMQEDGDFEKEESKKNEEVRVWIERWEERGYSVVNIRSRDRPRLLFDTVCTLTDMRYSVFHAVVGSKGAVALQEYYVRHMDGGGCAEAERARVTRCLVAAIQRRVSHGLRLEVCTKNRQGLLSDVTRVFRENGLTLTRAECTTRGERAVGTFYVTDTSGGDVEPKMVEAVRAEIGGSVSLVVNGGQPGWPPVKKSQQHSNRRPRFSSLGSMLWSHIINFGGIRS